MPRTLHILFALLPAKLTPLGPQQLLVRYNGARIYTFAIMTVAKKSETPQPHLPSTTETSISPADDAQPSDNVKPDPGKQEQQLSETPVLGINSVEAIHRAIYHTGRSGYLLLYVTVLSLGLTIFAYSLDGGITPQFDIVAASAYSMHAEVGTINTATSIISGVTKPVIGKLADLMSRPSAYAISLVFYMVGYIIAASSTNFTAYVIGISFTAVGKAGINLLCQIVIGDLTTLQWRGFWTGMTIAPYLVTTFITGFISDALVPDKWRWGLGMFVIIMPVLLLPAIFALYGIQRRAKKIVDESSTAASGKRGVMRTAWEGLVAVDIPGVILLGFAFALILLPLSLAESAEGGWTNTSMIVMEVMGFVILALFIMFELWVAPQPIMARKVIRNKVFLAALGANLFEQLTTSVGSNYFSSYMYIIKDWPNYTWTVFIGIRTLSLTVFSIIYGLYMARFHRYKTLMVVGVVVKIVGYAMCFESHNRFTKDTAVLAISEILIGVSAFTAMGSRVGAMASVPHEDMASIIAAYFLWTYLGSSAGFAIASAIWTNNMLKFMREETPPGTSEETLRTIYGSITALRTEYAPGDPIREGAIRAYTRTNGIIYIVAATVTVLSVFCAISMPSRFLPFFFSRYQAYHLTDYYLGKQQNAVTNTGLDGMPVDVPARGNSKTGLWNRMKHFRSKTMSPPA